MRRIRRFGLVGMVGIKKNKDRPFPFTEILRQPCRLLDHRRYLSVRFGWSLHMSNISIHQNKFKSCHNVPYAWNSNKNSDTNPSDVKLVAWLTIYRYSQERSKLGLFCLLSCNSKQQLWRSRCKIPWNKKPKKQNKMPNKKRPESIQNKIINYRPHWRWKKEHQI